MRATEMLPRLLLLALAVGAAGAPAPATELARVAVNDEEGRLGLR